MGIISGLTALARLKALKMQELMIEQEAINKKKVIRQGDEKAMEQLATQEALFRKKKLAEVDRAEQQSALKMKQNIQSVMAPIQSAIQGSKSGRRMIQGTQTLSQAIENLGQSMLASLVGFMAKWVMEWAAGQSAVLFGHEDHGGR